MDLIATLDRLAEGNRRFVAGAPERVDLVERREANATGQRPWAAIVACSDSRVAPEIIFDTSIGDLFVVRTGGNVVDELVLGSLRFAVEALGAPFIVVLGHYGCGAVEATCGGDVPAHLACVCDEIRPAADAARSSGAGEEALCDEAVRRHAEAMAGKVAHDEQLKAHGIPVAWGVYDVATGTVRFADESGELR